MNKTWKSLVLGVVLTIGLAVLVGARGQEWQWLGSAPLDGGNGLTTVNIGTGICIVEAQDRTDTPELACYDEDDGWGKTIRLEGLGF